jgi:hypothetical protein
MSYKGGELARWYFQDAAIRATLERMAAGQKKILLSLATGTGKTIISAQLLPFTYKNKQWLKDFPDRTRALPKTLSPSLPAVEIIEQELTAVVRKRKKS